MKTNFTSYLCLLMLSSSLAFSQHSETADLKKNIQVKLDSLRELYQFPGATFAVILPNGERFSVATGVADSLNRIPMETGHRMLSGSNGKTLFVAAALILEAEGAFDLDDPISTYLREEAWFHRLPNASGITMRMLMNHTSGLEEYYGLGDFMEKVRKNPYASYSPLETFSYVFDRKPLFEAGTDWAYADTNFLLLGYIVEKISGRKMYDLIEEHIIRPYHLEQTEPSINPQLRNLAVGYSGEHSPFPFHGAMVYNDSLVFNPQFEWAGGGFISNVNDLAGWAKTFYQFDAIAEENRAEMQERVVAKTGKDHYYGLGVQIRPSEDLGYSYGHSGWFPGYVTDAVYFPDVDLAMAIQFNSDDFRIMKMPAYAYLLELSKLLQVN